MISTFIWFKTLQERVVWGNDFSFIFALILRQKQFFENLFR